MGYGNTEVFLTREERNALIWNWMGKTVDVTVDRPIGYVHTTKGITLEQLSLEEFQAVHPAFDEGVYEAIDLMTCVSQRGSYGGPCVAETTRQIAELAEFVAGYQ